MSLTTPRTEAEAVTGDGGPDHRTRVPSVPGPECRPGIGDPALITLSTNGLRSEVEIREITGVMTGDHSDANMAPVYFEQFGHWAAYTTTPGSSKSEVLREM